MTRDELNLLLNPLLKSTKLNLDEWYLLGYLRGLNGEDDLYDWAKTEEHGTSGIYTVWRMGVADAKGDSSWDND